MLSSGYEGVREIQKRLTNTMGWSATSGMVDNWVYDEVRGCLDCWIQRGQNCSVSLPGQLGVRRGEGGGGGKSIVLN